MAWTHTSVADEYGFANRSVLGHYREPATTLSNNAWPSALIKRISGPFNVVKSISGKRLNQAAGNSAGEAAFEQVFHRRMREGC